MTTNGSNIRILFRTKSDKYCSVQSIQFHFFRLQQRTNFTLNGIESDSEQYKLGVSLSDLLRCQMECILLVLDSFALRISLLGRTLKRTLNSHRPTFSHGHAHGAGVLPQVKRSTGVSCHVRIISISTPRPYVIGWNRWTWLISLDKISRSHPDR